MTAPKVDLQRFAHRAIETRVAVEWSPAELAARAGLKPHRVEVIECTGELTAEEAEAIARAFGSTVEQMLLIDHAWRPPPAAPELGPVEDRPCAHVGCGRPRAEHRLTVTVEALR